MLGDILLIDLREKSVSLKYKFERNSFQIEIHNNLPVFSIIVPGTLNRYPGRLKVFFV